MLKNDKGFTLIEVLIALSLFSIVSFIAILTPNELYHRTILTSAAREIKGALELAQNLSIDQSKEICVEVIGNTYRIKENYARGEIIILRNLNKNISIYKESKNRISYNRHGETSYGKFILITNKGKKIDIDTSIATGRVSISNIY